MRSWKTHQWLAYEGVDEEFELESFEADDDERDEADDFFSDKPDVESILREYGDDDELRDRVVELKKDIIYLESELQFEKFRRSSRDEQIAALWLALELTRNNFRGFTNLAIRKGFVERGSAAEAQFDLILGIAGNCLEKATPDDEIKDRLWEAWSDQLEKMGIPRG